MLNTLPLSRTAQVKAECVNMCLLIGRPLVGIQEGSYHGHSGSIMAGEFDRLSFLLRSAFEQASIDTEGSPMDVTPTPFTGTYRTSLHCVDHRALSAYVLAAYYCCLPQTTGGD